MYLLATHVVETCNCVCYTTDGFEMLAYNLIDRKSREYKLQAERTSDMRGMLEQKNAHSCARGQGVFPRLRCQS